MPAGLDVVQYAFDAVEGLQDQAGEYGIEVAAAVPQLAQNVLGDMGQCAQTVHAEKTAGALKPQVPLMVWMVRKTLARSSRFRGSRSNSTISWSRRAGFRCFR
jgi:hypothetical protein